MNKVVTVTFYDTITITISSTSAWKPPSLSVKTLSRVGNDSDLSGAI